MSSDRDSNDGPVVQFKWTFPLFRMVDARASKIKDVVANKPGKKVASKVKNLQTTVSSEEDDEEEDGIDSRLDNMRERLNRISADDNAVLNKTTEDNESVVEFADGVFVPVTSNVAVGEDVEIFNSSEDDISIEFDDGQIVNIQAGFSESVSFQEPGAVDYAVNGDTEDSACGGIIVGDTDETPELPCQQDTEREIFDEEATVSISAPKPMSVAAEEKQEGK